MKKKTLFLISLLFILSLQLVSAVKTVQINEQTENTLTITYPKFDYFKMNEDFNFHIHVYDSNATLLDNTSTSCYIHLYNNSGNHIVEGEFEFDDNGQDFFYIIGGNNFSYAGEYTMMSWCNTTKGTGGFESGAALATPNGNQNNNVTSVGIILGIIGIIFILLYFTNSLDNTHFIFKLICYSFIPLLFVVASKVGLSASAGLEIYHSTFLFYKTSLWFMRLYYTYFFIYLFYEIFSYFKKKNTI